MLVDIINEQVKEHEVSLVIVNQSYSRSLLESIDHRVRIIKLNRKEGSKNPIYFICLNHILYTHGDIIHLHSSTLSKVLLGPINRNVVYTAHCMGVNIDDVVNVKHIFAISDSVKDDLLRRSKGQISSDKIVVIPNGINVERIQCRPRNKVFSKLSIVNVSRLDMEIKGQDILIKAIAILKSRGISNVAVDFIGDGISRESLESLSVNLHVSDQVNFLGLKDRNYIYDHLCEYDLMCHPSRYEGFGLTVAEGMAAGLPVLVSTGDGPYEIIGQGKYGFSFENGNAESCADALEKIIKNYNQVASVVELAQQHVKTHYSIKSTASSYILAYEGNMPDKGVCSSIFTL